MANQPAPTVSVPSDPPGTTIRFFLSSTFADFQTERNVLQKRVFPQLRELCAASGFRLQPIDLRWGVSEAAGTERQTLRICFDELDRCRQLSPDFFLLIQLGNRYGTYILPPEVPGDLATRVLAHCAPEDQGRFAAAYRLDENSVPPAYVLLRADGPERAEDETLRLALERAGAAAGVSEDERLLFGGSATHREIQLGLLGAPSGAGREAGVLCAARAFRGALQGPEVKRFAEQDQGRVTRVRRLTDAVLARLPANQVLRYEVAWPDAQGPTFDEAALAQAYLGLLRPKLEAVIVARTAARAALAARGRDEVALANAAFEHERAAQVVGRKAELARLVAYLRGESGAGSPLVVTGAAGSGKSSLLAAAAGQAAATPPGAALVVRYCGVTPGTGSLSELLNDLRRAIARAYRRPEPQQVSDENELVADVARDLGAPGAMSARPLLLLVDAIDQLSVAAARNDWLPTRLGPHVRVVVSVLDGRPELMALHARLPEGQVLALGPLDRSDGQAILRGLLAQAPPRALAPAQQDALLGAFAVQGLPLYLRLAVTEARRWRSFDPPIFGDRPLPQSVPDLLDALLTRLEAKGRHGRMLVARALGNLAAAVYGLAEDEALDLLAQDADVRAAQHELSPSSPDIDPKLPLPVALWARLAADIGPLLGEREMDGVRLATFFHQQLRETTRARYLDSGSDGVAVQACHRALAGYFAGPPWRYRPGQWNWRKARELVRQQEQAGDWTAADRALGGLAASLEDAFEETQRTAAKPGGGDSADVANINALINAVADRLYTGAHRQVGLRFFLLRLTIARKEGDRAGEAMALRNLGALANELGRPEEARNYLERALTVTQETGDRAGEGVALNNLGNIADGLGRHQEANSYFERALTIARKTGNRTQEAAALGNLGNVAASQGRFEDARRYLEQDLAIVHEAGDRAGQVSALLNLASLAGFAGQREEVLKYHAQALALAREVGDRTAEGAILHGSGLVAGEQGRTEEAYGYHERALAIWRQLGDRRREGASLANLGALAAAQGRIEEAYTFFGQQLAIARALGDRSGEGGALLALSVVAKALGRTEEARAYNERGLALARELGEREDDGPTLTNLGELAVLQGRTQEARQYYERALAVARKTGNRRAEASCLTALGSLVALQGRIEEARANFEQAIAIY